jgi:hypothetical protein
MTKKEEMIKKIFKALAIMKKWDRIQWARKDWVINFEYIDYPKEKECHPIIIDDLLHYKHQMNKDLEMTNSIESLMEKYNILSMQEDWCDKFLNELKSLQSIEQPNVDEIIEKIVRDMWERPFVRTWEWEERNMRKILTKHLTSKAPTAEVCKSCLWKKKLSVYEWVTIWSADFPWDKNILIDKWWIKMVDCSRCKGTWFEPQEVKVDKVEIKRKIIVKIKREFIDELIEQCLPFDDYNNKSVIWQDRLKQIKNDLLD